MIKKIVRRVPVAAVDPETDLIGLIDLIEFELLFAGNSTARDRLTEVVNEIHRSEGLLSEDGVRALLDVMERLKKIERLLSDCGFKTGSAPERNDAGESDG